MSLCIIAAEEAAGCIIEPGEEDFPALLPGTDPLDALEYAFVMEEFCEPGTNCTKTCVNTHTVNNLINAQGVN